MPKSITYTLLIITMLLWAANFYVVKVALNYYSPMGVAAWRFFFGVITLFLIVRIQFGNIWSAFRFSRSELGYIFLMAFSGIFLTIYFFNIGLKTTSAVNGTLIVATSPAITGVFSYLLLKQRITLMQWFSIGVSFFGVAIILVQGDLSKLLQLQFEPGDIYVLLMAICFSLSQIIISKYLAQIDAILMTALGSLMAFLLFALFSWAEWSSISLPSNIDFWVSVIFMGVLSTGIAYTAFYYCVVHLGATISTLYMNLIPFFAVLLAFPFGESIDGSQIVGGGIVILGLLLFGYARSRISSVGLDGDP